MNIGGDISLVIKAISAKYNHLIMYCVYSILHITFSRVPYSGLFTQVVAFANVLMYHELVIFTVVVVFTTLNFVNGIKLFLQHLRMST